MLYAYRHYYYYNNTLVKPLRPQTENLKSGFKFISPVFGNIDVPTFRLLALNKFLPRPSPYTIDLRHH